MTLKEKIDVAHTLVRIIDSEEHNLRRSGVKNPTSSLLTEARKKLEEILKSI